MLFVLRLNAINCPPYFYFSPQYLESRIHPADIVKNLGVWFDADFSFSEHVKNTCKASFLQMHDRHRSRHYLTQKVAVLAANALWP